MSSLQSELIHYRVPGVTNIEWSVIIANGVKESLITANKLIVTINIFHYTLHLIQTVVY